MLARRSFHLAALVPLVALVLLAAGCATTTSDEAKGPVPPPIELTATDDGQTVQMRTGQILVLKLISSRDRGAGWTIASSTAPTLRPLGTVSFEEGGGGNGISIGTERRRFRAVEPGSVDLILQFRPNWHQETPVTKTVQFKVEVE